EEHPYPGRAGSIIGGDANVLLAGEHDARRPLEREQHHPVGEPPGLLEVASLLRAAIQIHEEVPDPGHAGEIRGEGGVAALEIARDLPRYLQVSRVPQRRVEAQRDDADARASDAEIGVVHLFIDGSPVYHLTSVPLLRAREFEVEEPPRGVAVL